MFWTKVEKERLKRAYRARMSQAICIVVAMSQLRYNPTGRKMVGSPPLY